MRLYIMINCNENENNNEKHTINTNTQSITYHGKIMSIFNKQNLTFEPQFIKKLSITEPELKKALPIKKACCASSKAV